MAGRGMWIGIGLGALVLGGAGVAVMVVKSDRDSRSAGKAQVVEFGEKLAKVRSCLLGEAPLAADPGVALVLHQITDPQGADVTRCAPLTVKLKRPEGPSSGSNAVETDWTRMRATIREFVSAVHAGSSPDAVADALAALDADYARLRENSGLPPVVYPTGPEAAMPAAPEGTPIRLGGNDDLAPDEVLRIGDRVIVTGTTGGGPALAVVERPDKITSFYLGESAMRAGPPGADWGVWSAVPDEKSGELVLHAATLGAGGDPAEGAAGVVIARIKAPSAETTASLTPHAAIGAGKDRAVVYSMGLDTEEHWLALSHDSGATWTARRIAENGTDAVTRFHGEHGRVDLTWRATDGAVWWMPIDGARLAASLTGEPEAMVLAVAEDDYEDAPVACLAPTQIWWNTPSGVVRAPLAGGELTKIATERLPMRELLCDDTAIVGLTSDGDFAVAVRCDGKGCDSTLRVPGVHRDAIEWSIGAKHGLVAAAVASGYLVLWTPGDKRPTGKARVAFPLPPNSTVRALVEWDGKLHAVISTEQRVTILPLP